VTATLPAPPSGLPTPETFEVSLTLLKGYAFRVDFRDEPASSLFTDEPRPLGNGGGPSPSRMLAAAVVNCLASSLLFCLARCEALFQDYCVVTESVRGGIDVQVTVTPRSAAPHYEDTSQPEKQ